MLQDTVFLLKQFTSSAEILMPGVFCLLQAAMLAGLR
jgi:hypothetical protein